MSIVNTETLQADKLVAKDGKDETEVSIPSFVKKTPWAKALYRTPPGGSPYFSPDSYNVSSFVKISTYVWHLNLKTPKDNTGGQYVNYGVVLTGHDRVLGRFLETYHYSDADTINYVEVHYNVYQDPAKAPTVTSTDIIVF